MNIKSSAIRALTAFFSVVVLLFLFKNAFLINIIIMTVIVTVLIFKPIPNWSIIPAAVGYALVCLGVGTIIIYAYPILSAVVVF